MQEDTGVRGGLFARSKVSLSFASMLKNVRLLGFGVAPFLSEVFTKTLTENSIPSTLVFYSAYGFFLLLIGYLFASRKNRPFTDQINRAIPFIGHGSTIIALVFLLVAALLDSINYLFAAAVFGGIGMAGMFFQWFYLYTFAKLEVAVCYVFISLALAAFLRLMFSMFPLEIGIIITFVLALVSQLVYAQERKKCEDTLQLHERLKQVATSPKNPESNLIPFLVILIVYSFILALLRGVYADVQYLFASNVINLVLRMVISLVLFLIVAWRNFEVNFTQFCQVSLVFIMTTILVFRFFAGSESLFDVAFASAVRGVVVLFMYIAIVQIIHYGTRHPNMIIGVAGGAYIVAAGAGLAFSIYFDAEFLAEEATFNAAYIVVVATVVILFFLQHQTAKPPAKNTASEKTESEESEAENKAHLIEIQEKYGLTAREVDVLSLMSKGHSKRYIAETLFISENTVRSYSKNLYAKLNIHSKQELLTFVEHAGK